MNSSKVGRNDPCFCQSGKKYKHCCFADRATANAVTRLASPGPTRSMKGLLEQGLAKHQAGDLLAAGAIYNELLALAPAHADALHLLGLIDFAQGNHLAALHRIEAAIRESHHDPRYFYNLGTVLMALKRPHEAAAQFRISTEMDSSYAFAHGNLGAALRETGDLKEAIESFRKALALAPEDVDTWASLSVTLIQDDQSEPAFECLERAVGLNPRSAKSLNNVGLAFRKFGDVRAAATFFARSIELDPLYAQPLINLGSLVFDNPFLDDAELSANCFRRALEIDPGNNVAHSTYLMTLLYSSKTTPDDLYACHRQFGERIERPFAASIAPHTNDRNSERRLRIGYVSGDLYNHAVATFIEPILTLHNPALVEIFCYYNNTIEDGVSRRLMARAHHWIPCQAMSDDTLAARIRADRIDILIDLSGHSLLNRLAVFAQKPAPLQASWLGYPGTTGLTAMDYYLADPFFLPADRFETQFTEKIVRLRTNVPFLPYPDAPDINPLPALKNGYITFASFNQLHKYTTETTQRWAQLLNALPDSKLLVGGLASNVQADVTAMFTRYGIEASRLQFRQRGPIFNYLQLHHDVDLCLDTYPYTGGTTTMHALWMGVPTLSLQGPTAASRQGSFALGHAGLDQFLVNDASDYVQKGINLTADLPALANLRSGLRTRFAKAAFGQPAVVTASLENALRIMWQRWCAGLPAISFDA